MAAYDEAMHVTAHEAHVEVRTQDERGASTRTPADDRSTAVTRVRIL